ncbi:hypothetical protein FA15DRAFT_667237 [Coprinopsis marcescibilis]|uniref:Uncharacterized protein n=1 Tax=Coprinopsis marcescibilis TaxID=230819 RepID=A0A5C3L0S4_COPMA|nr:hypothetical protein FA15DRAFT_667237 [Coprinopsis marcescibilis]
MRWTARPERREICLVLFCVAVYLFSYNIEASIDLVGIGALAAQDALLKHLGLGETKLLDADGRKPPGWRDKLESDIFGDWAWDEGYIAGDEAGRSSKRGSSRHGAQWIRRDTIGTLGQATQEPLTVNDALSTWGEDPPTTRVIKHTPGYTILDNVFAYNGTVFLITDDANFPPAKSIVTTMGTGFGPWKTLTTAEGKRTIGKFGGVIRGVSWMSANVAPNNLTLFDLWRTYSTLDPSIDKEGRTSLPPPHRLIFPHNRFFVDANPPPAKHWIRRERSETGAHPYLIKAAFPNLDMQYYEDWEDLHAMAVPFVFERLVISDRRAAASAVLKGQPFNTPVFALETSRWWWEPIRRTLALYFDRLEEGDLAISNQGWFNSKMKPIVTLVDNQANGELLGQSLLSQQDRELLIRTLRKLARDRGYEFHVVSTDLKETSWDTRMDTIVRSTIVLGVHGDHLLDSIWMRPSSKATLMELFPENDFVLTRELAARSIGINYVAWWGNKQFFGETLPTPSEESNRPIQVDSEAIANAIHAILSRK